MFISKRGNHHGYFRNHRNFGGGMANFYRLRVVCTFVLSLFSFNAFATSPIYTAYQGTFSSTATTAEAACTAVIGLWLGYFNGLHPGEGYGATFSGAAQGICHYIGFNNSVSADPSWTGNYDTKCEPGKLLDASGTNCIAGDTCQLGFTAGTTSSPVWCARGDLVCAYTAQAAAVAAEGCMTGVAGATGPMGGSGGCSVTYKAGPAPIGLPGVSGHTSYTSFLTGTTTGGTCTPLPPPSVSPEPPCEGQSGQIDGKTVCLARESEAEAAARIASAAAAAAQAASAAATNAGATAAAAAAAAAAAGSTMAEQLRAGASGPVATAAAAAAGAAAAAAATAGSTPAESKTAGSTAGTVEAAGQRAQLIAQSSGASGTIIQQAVSAARAAAGTAAAGVLVNGGTQAQADAAGRAAGITATAIVLTGGSAGAAAAGGAAAGNGAAAGAAAGNGTGTGKPDEPVADFCKTHPQAKMCKTEFDGEFSGVCGAPPICKGDAVMCAVAAATFATNCALRDPKIPTPLYDSALLKTGDQTTALSGNSTVNVSSSQFDQTELLGGAAGMTDRSITVMHSTVNLPFSNVNVWLARLGIVLQAVTFLLCARVVVRG